MPVEKSELGSAQLSEEETRATKEAYNNNFYELYCGKDYLLDPNVRAHHDKVFADFRKFTGPDDLCVVDLGCATGEFERHGKYNKYVGIDLNNTGKVKNLLLGDYRDRNLQLPFSPTAFISLFSAELFFPSAEKYAIYEDYFRRYPTINYALISGMFYNEDGKRHLEKIGETGGIVSYQTIEDPLTHISSVFREYRFTKPDPSPLFGNTCVTVWKFLVRNL